MYTISLKGRYYQDMFYFKIYIIYSKDVFLAKKDNLRSLKNASFFLSLNFSFKAKIFNSRTLSKNF